MPMNVCPRCSQITLTLTGGETVECPVCSTVYNDVNESKSIIEDELSSTIDG